MAATGHGPRPANCGATLRGGPLPRLHVDQTDRSHLDLWAEPGPQQTEVDRLLALGATKPDWVYPEGADFVVLADTEGNLFCVIGD